MKIHRIVEEFEKNMMLFFDVLKERRGRIQMWMMKDLLLDSLSEDEFISTLWCMCDY